MPFRHYGTSLSIAEHGYSVHEWDIEALDEDDLQAIVDLSNEIRAETEPRHTDLTADEFRMFVDTPGQIRRRFVVRSGTDRPVALLGTQYADDESNPQRLRVTLTVAPRHRRRGIGTRLLDQAAGIARDLGRSTLTGEVSDTVAAGGVFLSAVGGKGTLDHHLSSLEIADLDRDLLQQWVDQGPGRAPGYSVHVFDGTFPEEYLDGLAHLYLVLERDMPTPDGQEPREWTPELVHRFMEHFLQGTEALTATAIHDESGQAAGMSQLVRRTVDPGTWIVTTTMVDPMHRGHALGKWVKGAVNLEALDRWTDGEYQETGNAVTNDAMLGINQAMGFEREYTMTEVELGVDQAEKYLASRNE